MKYKLLQITTLLHLLYEWTCCSLAFAFVEEVFTKQAPHFYLIPVTGVWFVVSYILRAKAGNYLVLLVGHLLMRLPIYLLPISRELQWVYFIIPCYLFFASISGVRKKTNESGYSGENELPWPSFLFCLAAYLVGGHLEQPGLQIYAYITTLVLLLLYLAIVYTDGMEHYLDAACHVSKMPLRQILSVNTIMVGAIIIVLILGLGLGELLGFQKLVALVWDAMLAVIRIVAMIFGAIFEFIGRWFKNGDPGASDYDENADGNMPERMHSIGQMLMPVLYVCLIAIGIYLLYKILARLVRFLMTKRVISSDQIELVPAQKTDEEKKQRKKKDRLIMSRDWRARKYYKDYIERYRYDITLKQTETSREIQDELQRKDLADVTELTACYEEIRYGNSDVDRAMLQKIRRLAGK